MAYRGKEGQAERDAASGGVISKSREGWCAKLTACMKDRMKENTPVQEGHL